MINKTKPEFDDISLISNLFVLFCEHKKIDPLAYKAVMKKDNVYICLLFIALIIKLYNRNC